MSAPHPALEAIRRDISETRSRLSALEDAERQLVAIYDKPPAVQPTSGTFRIPIMGPSEALRTVVAREPGLSRVDAVEAALHLVKSEASDPKRSLSETVRSLIHRKKLVERNGGLYPA